MDHLDILTNDVSNYYCNQKVVWHTILARQAIFATTAIVVVIVAKSNMLVMIRGSMFATHTNKNYHGSDLTGNFVQFRSVSRRHHSQKAS